MAEKAKIQIIQLPKNICELNCKRQKKTEKKSETSKRKPTQLEDEDEVVSEVEVEVLFLMPIPRRRCTFAEVDVEVEVSSLIIRWMAVADVSHKIGKEETVGRLSGYLAIGMANWLYGNNQTTNSMTN